MKAPSEKHLEDYLFAHPETFGLYGVDDDIQPIPHCVPLWRQVVIESGVVDLVGTWFMQSLSVIEIKKGAINTKSLAQVLRYKRDFRNMIHRLVCGYGDTGGPFRDHMPMDYRYTEWWKSEIVKCILIGEEVPDKNLLLACEACGIEVYTYQYHTTHYTLSNNLANHLDGHSTGWNNYTPFEMIQYLLKFIGTQLKYIAEDKLNNGPFDAITAAEWYLEMSNLEES
ncbi:MAG: hypothetical protein ACYTBJ_19840 [Planctomycetota bacterium]|jgi:hypothetical protein